MTAKEIDPELLNQLFSLDEEVLPQVKAVVDDLSKNTTTGNAKLSPEEIPFYNAIVDTLRDNHKKMIPPEEGRNPVPRLKGFDYGSFRTAFHFIEDLLNTEVGPCSKAERVRFYKLASDCTYNYLKSKVKSTKSIQELHEVKNIIQDNVNDGDDVEFCEKVIKKTQAQLDGRKPAIGIAAMLEGLQHAEDSIDSVFPGYLKAGFLHAVVKVEDVQWP